MALSSKALKTGESLLLTLTAAVITYANYLAFVLAPNERTMGPVQRIFYFHVSSAIAAYCSIAVVLIASVLYLANRSVKADIVAAAAGELGFVFCTIVLASGMIWGHSAWNTWFNPEPRLISFLLLWLLFLSFNLLRVFGDPQRVASHSAILGIIGAITVPLMVFSIKLLPPIAGLHPQVMENRGLLEPLFKQALFVAMIGVVLLNFLLLWVRIKIGFLKLALEQKSEQ